MNKKIYLIKYIGNHPIASLTPDRTFEIAEMENCVYIDVNKQAKQPYGEGTQIEVSVGDRLTKHQAKQIADTYETTLVPINDIEPQSDQQSEMLLD
tara:strand:+ start:366 stop:653 length:288 start_codon:yes stop_codon:yes gene_type:complete